MTSYSDKSIFQYCGIPGFPEYRNVYSGIPIFQYSAIPEILEYRNILVFRYSDILECQNFIIGISEYFGGLENWNLGIF